MDRKPVSDPNLAAQGEFEGSIDRSSNFREQAFNHNLGRNVRVIKLLGYVALMRQNGVRFTGSIDCVKAMRQNFSSSRSMTQMGLPTGPMQAAHFLPGQVTVAAREISEAAANHATRGQIQFLFSAVEHLPLAFNQADSAAEAKGERVGLCAALLKACTTVIRHPAASVNPGGKMPLHLVHAGYEDWHNGALEALRSAIEKKLSKPGLPPLAGDPFEGYTPESIAARSTAPASQWNRDEAVRILEYYLEDQQTRTWEWAAAQCRAALREVELLFRP